MQDEAFHEIQLNGKQLVFLFMAATVVSVVIFLCGVMVGRGVPTPRAAEQAAATDQASFDPTALAPAPAVATSTDGELAASGETLTYPGRLEDADPPAEHLKTPEAARAARAEAALPQPAAEPIAEPVSTPAVAKTPAVALAAAAEPVSPSKAAPRALDAAPVAAAAVAKEPAGSGFVVQVAAVRERAEADIIARRLASKGYPAFVTTPAGAANVFRVRVGKYPDRRAADSIASRLEKEEQFKPWVTR
jgi:cell division septation protein DedD